MNLRKNNRSFCFAPNNTLRFSTIGHIHICCRNRYKVVGTYPENSIEEIWNGKKIKEIRNSLKRYDLSEGCLFCQQMLFEKNYNFLKALDYDAFQTKYQTVIRKLEFELSNQCNLECGMCFGELSSSIRQNIEKLPKIESPYDDKFIDQLRPLWQNIKRVTFAGGEPFLIEIYYKIWEEILKYNSDIEIIVITNGTILNTKIKELLSRGKFFFAVSIDSFYKDKYEEIRKNAIFEKTIENFEYLYNYSVSNNRWITINICPMQQNWNEIPKMLSELNRRNISVYFNQVDYPTSYSLRSLSKEEITKVIDILKNSKIEIFDNVVSDRNIIVFKSLISHLETFKNDKGNHYIEDSKLIISRNDTLDFLNKIWSVD